MFLANSRYFGIPVVQCKLGNGRETTAVKLRRLPYVAGEPAVVTGPDRLDIIAQRKYSDPTLFWHIADANTELEANHLLKGQGQAKETRVIIVPDK